MGCVQGTHIFRDYVLTEKVPYIPINYIPQLNYSRYIDGLEFLLQEGEITYDQLASELGISKGTADNLVRDLVMIGHAEANRRSESVKSLQTTEEEWEAKLVEFFSSHIVYRRMLERASCGFRIHRFCHFRCLQECFEEASAFSETALECICPEAAWVVCWRGSDSTGCVGTYSFPKAAPSVLNRVGRLVKPVGGGGTTMIDFR